MTGAMTSEAVSTGLLRVAERARRDPRERIVALARHVDVVALRRAYDRLRKDAAVGHDGVSVEAYGKNVDDNLRALHEGMKAGRWRHGPILRVHIPKDDGRTRPIGISCVEDKVVQGALKEALEAVYEPAFSQGSYGFRPRRRAHDAIRALNRAVRDDGVRFILEADIVSFFDSIDRTMLMKMLRDRIVDESFMRLVGKCLHVGVLDGAEYSEPGEGTAQGSVLSPLLGNVFLHHVLDEWLENVVKPQLRGRCVLVRYADDFVLGFSCEDDAVLVNTLLTERMAAHNLKLHPTKTRLLAFSPPRGDGNKGAASFDFLGFTIYWRKTRNGKWAMACKTKRRRLSRSIKNVAEWCRGHRHLEVKEQQAALARRMNGHINYFGVSGNARDVTRYVGGCVRAWFKWLRRRSQRARISWERFNLLLERYPLPRARIVVDIWTR